MLGNHSPDWLCNIVHLIRQEKQIRRYQLAGLAQSVERETLNLKVAGSTPAFGFFFDFFFFNLWSVYSTVCIWYCISFLSFEQLTTQS